MDKSPAGLRTAVRHLVWNTQGLRIKVLDRAFRGQTDNRDVEAEGKLADLLETSAEMQRLWRGEMEAEKD